MTNILLAAHMVASWYNSPFHGMTCATRDFPVGTHLRITEIHNRISVVVVVKERGPALWVLRRDQRVKIDLSKEAFERLDGIELGHCDVTVIKL